MKLKGVTGTRTSGGAWVNSSNAKEPPDLDIPMPLRNVKLFFNLSVGGAWLSSARVVRCWVKSRNEAQPLSSVASRVKLGTLERLPGITWRKVGMTSNHHAPYDQGYTRATMA